MWVLLDILGPGLLWVSAMNGTMATRNFEFRPRRQRDAPEGPDDSEHCVD